MSDFFNSHFERSYGNVHAGTGSQFNVEFRTYSELLDVIQGTRGKKPSAVAEEQLSWLQARFITPSGFPEAATTLRDTRTVLLRGPRGGGLHTAAKMLLRQVPEGSGPVRELLPDIEFSDAIGLPPTSVAAGDRLLLSLGRHPQIPWDLVEKQLPALLDVLPHKDARLVVVLPHSTQLGLPAYLERFTQTLQRPDASRVLRRHLRREGVDPELTVPLPESITRHLDAEPPMAEIERLAADIIKAGLTASTGEDFATWSVNALRGVERWAEEVATLVRENRQGGQRALLLATALFHGSHTHVVHLAAASLLKAVKHPDEAEPLLDRADLAERLKQLGAHSDPKTGVVTFGKYTYETAVIRHFWQHVPELRRPLRHWASEVIGDRQLSAAERDMAVDRLTDLYLHAVRPDELTELVELWTRDGRGKHQIRSAYRVLERGLDDARCGQTFRQKTYSWATTARIAPRLAHVLVAVCAGPMAVRHPDQALVRLHHLARHQRGSDTAREALIELVEQDHRLYRRLLERLAEGLRRQEHETEVALFHTFADPVRLCATRGPRRQSLLLEHGVRGQLTDAWRALYLRYGHEQWQPLARSWFGTAEEQDHGALRDALVRLPVSAGHGDVTRLARLYETARDSAVPSASGRSGRSEIADRVLAGIDAMQRPRSDRDTSTGNEESK